MDQNPIPPDEEDPLDALREMPVGVNDPNIIGDVGPTDVPPGSDPPTLAEPVLEEEEPFADEDPLPEPGGAEPLP